MNNKECWKDAKRKGKRGVQRTVWERGKGNQTGRTRKRSGGEKRIWWRAGMVKGQSTQAPAPSLLNT
eukprot:3337941-Pleurochrysis_carterae.AAC.2